MYLKFILEVIIDNLNNFLGKIFTPCCCTGDHEYNSAFNFFLSYFFSVTASTYDQSQNL